MSEINRWLAADKASELTGKNNTGGARQQERTAFLQSPITCEGECIYRRLTQGQAPFSFKSTKMSVDGNRVDPIRSSLHVCC